MSAACSSTAGKWRNLPPQLALPPVCLVPIIPCWLIRYALLKPTDRVACDCGVRDQPPQARPSASARTHQQPKPAHAGSARCIASCCSHDISRTFPRACSTPSLRANGCESLRMAAWERKVLVWPMNQSLIWQEIEPPAATPLYTCRALRTRARDAGTNQRPAPGLFAPLHAIDHMIHSTRLRCCCPMPQAAAALRCVRQISLQQLPPYLGLGRSTRPSRPRPPRSRRRPPPPRHRRGRPDRQPGWRQSANPASRTGSCCRTGSTG